MPLFRIRPLALFYMLGIYVLLQFSWWSYLLVRLNKEVFQHKIEMLAATGEKDLIEARELLHTQLKDRWMMVAGEGFVFLTILIFGIFKTRQGFKQEFALARQQKNFLLSITHEFKSPLAAVKLNLQTLQKHELEKEQRAQILTNALRETERIHSLIENALLAARIESHSFFLHMEEFNLSECILSLIKSRTIPGLEQRAIDLKIEEDVYIKGDPLAISSIVLNLLENADKYSNKNTPITIYVAREKKCVVVEVRDNGIGIPDTEKSKIFDKFYRIGKEETRKTKGTGLGLFIVKHIAAFHQADIKVMDNVPVGTIFKLTLPLEPQVKSA
jgi:two-component system, OmpR family, phosphate regulon sensor histidine kinase PhoR